MIACIEEGMGSSVEVVHALVHDCVYRREDGVIGRSSARIGL